VRWIDTLPERAPNRSNTNKVSTAHATRIACIGSRLSIRMMYEESESCLYKNAYAVLTFGKITAVLYFNKIRIDDFIIRLAQVLLIDH
jgi:hypothetical protein